MRAIQRQLAMDLEFPPSPLQHLERLPFVPTTLLAEHLDFQLSIQHERLLLPFLACFSIPAPWGAAIGVLRLVRFRTQLQSEFQF